MAGRLDNKDDKLTAQQCLFCMLLQWCFQSTSPENLPKQVCFMIEKIRFLLKSHTYFSNSLSYSSCQVATVGVTRKIKTLGCEDSGYSLTWLIMQSYLMFLRLVHEIQHCVFDLVNLFRVFDCYLVNISSATILTVVNLFYP